MSNKTIISIVKTYDDYTLAIAYENIVKLKNEGLLMFPCILSLIHNDVCEKMGLEGDHYKQVETAIMFEIAKRFHDKTLNEKQ